MVDVKFVDTFVLDLTASTLTSPSPAMPTSLFRSKRNAAKLRAVRPRPSSVN